MTGTSPTDADERLFENLAVRVRRKLRADGKVLRIARTRDSDMHIVDANTNSIVASAQATVANLRKWLSE